MFRPLARFIGLYPNEMLAKAMKDSKFPSPLEVYRFISKDEIMAERNTVQLPSPREADRFISPSCRKNHSDTNSAVSVPSRGYRFISKNG